VEVEKGESILNAALRSGIDIENMLVKNLALVQHATVLFVKVLIHWKKVLS